MRAWSEPARCRQAEPGARSAAVLAVPHKCLPSHLTLLSCGLCLLTYSCPWPFLVRRR